MTCILLAEDDSDLSDGLAKSLRHSGYSVDVARNGTEAETAAMVGSYDLLILDVGLPQKDGFAVLSKLRGAGKVLPVLLLTARDTSQDKIMGLDLGANDYLTKPFDVGELEARIRALLRKEKWGNQTKIEVGSVSFDTRANIFYLNDEHLELTAAEFHAFELLLQRRGRVVLKTHLIDHIAITDRDMSTNALDILIHRLRKKIDGSNCVIQTIKGLGFIIE